MIRWAFAAGAIASACGCAREPEKAETSARYDHAFSLSLGERARVEDRVTIGFAWVAEDTRFGSGADCPSAGNAAVVLALDDREGSATLTLHTAREPRRAAAVGHAVTLLALEPDVPPRDSTDYSATLVVSTAP